MTCPLEPENLTVCLHHQDQDVRFELSRATVDNQSATALTSESSAVLVESIRCCLRPETALFLAVANNQ